MFIRHLLPIIVGFSLIQPAFSGVVEEGLQWNAKDFPIGYCFVEPGEKTAATQLPYPKEAILKRLRESIENNFTPKTTGISFRYSEHCEDSRNFIHVRFVDAVGDTIAGYANTIGNYRADPEKNALRDVGINVIDRASSNPLRDKRAEVELLNDTADGRMTEQVFLHEMGHIAGLRHEHIRPANKSDATRIFQKGQKEETFINTIAYTPYDRYSIMNYGFSVLIGSTATYSVNEDDAPFIDLVKNRRFFSPTGEKKNGTQNYRVSLRISAGDEHTLRCYYGVEKNCQTYAF